MEWRYLGEWALVKHALRQNTFEGRWDHLSAECGVGPPWYGWKGTGSQHEYERVQELPECKNCLRKLRSKK